MTRARTLLVTLGVAFAPVAAADDAAEPIPTTLSPIVVVGAPVTLEPGSAYTLRASTLLASPGGNVADLLRFLPGVHVDRAGRSGSVSSLYLRGGDPNWTPIFVDGVRVNDPTNSRGGSANLALLDPALIDRVEIVRGPASALVGSDAIAGVINIVTRAPAQHPEATLFGEAGSRGYATARARASGPVLGGAAIQGAYADGGDVVAGGRSRLETVQGTLRIGVPSGTLQFVAYGLREAGHAYPEDSGGALFAERPALETHRNEQQTAHVSYAGEPVFGWSLRADATALSQRLDETSPAVPPGIRDPFGLPATTTASVYRRQTVRLVGETQAARWLRIAFGAQYERESGTSHGALQLEDFALPTDFALDRITRAVFGEARFESDVATVSAGLRSDRTGDRSSEPTPRLAAAFAVSADWQLVASYGKGFKLPSFFALSHPIVGNADLSPERSRGTDLGVRYRNRQDDEFSLTAFRLVVDDAIDFDPGPPPRLVNRDRFTSTGAEMTWQVRLHPALRTYGQLAHAVARTSADTTLRNRPRLQGVAGAAYAVADDLDTTASITFVGRNVDSSIPTGERTLGSYAVIGLSAVFRLTPKASLTAGIDNVADRRFEEMLGFPGPRRTFRLGLDAAL
jgi:vitamin B12 transporter